MPEWSEFWWASITGPRNLCEAVSHALHQKGNVCLIVPNDLPWRDQMRACIETDMHQMPDMESFYVEYIDVEDDCPDVVDVGRYLLERYASPEIAAGYRGRGKIQQYILDKRELNNRIFWIKGMNAEQEKCWLKFCRDYVPTQDSNGRFVLEVRWIKKESERRNLAVIRYSDAIKRYDLTLFNSVYLSREKSTYSPIWQQYIAVMCASLCDTDAETSQALIENCNFSSEEPIVGMQIVSEDETYMRRGENNDKHILNMIRRKDTAAVGAQIWKAQLQVLFPLIEMERVTFVEQYRERIQEALREQYYDFRTDRPQQVYQFGDIIDDPDDAELGTLYRMTKLKRSEDTTQYLLYIADEQSRNRVELLHAMRNSLAHGEYCAIDKVAGFINGHPFDWKN